MRRAALDNTCRKLRRFAIASLALAAFPFLASCQSADNDKESPATSVISKTISFSTPTPAWTLTPLAAYRVEGEHWCLFYLKGPDGMVAQVISEVTGTISFRDTTAEALPTRCFVIGKTWNWTPEGEITFIDSADSLKDALAEAEALALSDD